MAADRARIVPLPRILRPTHDEGLDGYLRRLAEANHLPPSYLYAQLARPGTGYPGRIEPDRLAAATARTLHAITRALPELQPTTRNPGRSAHNRTAASRNRLARAQTFAAIRQERAAGASIRSLAKKPPRRAAHRAPGP